MVLWWNQNTHEKKNTSKSKQRQLVFTIKDLNHYSFLISLNQDSRVTKQEGYWLHVPHTQRNKKDIGFRTGPCHDLI